MRYLNAVALLPTLALSLLLPLVVHGDVAKPNVVMVFIDDMGWADFSSFGNEEVETQNVDRLAREGLRFHQFYINAPICSPSRAALTTGLHPLRTGITSYLDSRKANEARGMRSWLDPQTPTLPRLLQEAGYATGHFGKWHLGGQRDVGDAPVVTEYGFDESLTNFEGLGPRVLPLLDSYDGSQARPYALGSDLLGKGPIFWEKRDHVTARYVDAAVSFIRGAQHRSEPFYLNLWPDDVHSPFFPPGGKKEGSSKHDHYLEVLNVMDEQLGALFDVIRDDPELRLNTLILICSDNGPERGAGSAGHFRGYKASLFEGGIRSPLIVWGPGLLADGSAGEINSESVFAAFDLVPTLLAIAGVEPPPGVGLDGEALPETLLGKEKKSRAAPLYFCRPAIRASDAAKGDMTQPDLAVRSGHWKLLCKYNGSIVSLFDVEADPGEQHNLAADFPEIVEQLSRGATSWYLSLSE